MNEEPRVEVRGLSKRFGRVLAVDDVSFELRAGTVTGFLGPNGAGKTTTLRILLGLVAPSVGEALINGVRYRDLTAPTRVVGAVLESSGFHPSRSARNHLRAIAAAAGIGSARVDEVLETVGLTESANRSAGGFSMGMRQRLELARALLGDPPILVLDEPANGLDPQGIAWLRTFMRHYAAQGRIVLVSSHLLAEAAQTVDDVVVLRGGRLVGRGRLDELLTEAKTRIEVRTTEPERLRSVLEAAGIAASGGSDDVVIADATTALAVGKAMAAAAIVVVDMRTSGETLEDLFFEMTETDGRPEAETARRA